MSEKLGKPTEVIKESIVATIEKYSEVMKELGGKTVGVITKIESGAVRGALTYGEAVDAYSKGITVTGLR
ncbi:MAG: hypothetical protein U1E15_09565 [Hyphomicrobiales bacterium]